MHNAPCQLASKKVKRGWIRASKDEGVGVVAGIWAREQRCSFYRDVMESAGLRHKRVAAPSEAPGPGTPLGSAERPTRWTGLLELPCELTHSVLLSLEARDLCKLSCSCR